MAEGTPIGALAVRIGADATGLISGLGEADKALGKTQAKFAEGLKVATAFAGAAAAAGAAVFAMVQNVAKSADELGKLSQKVGVSVESLSALKFAAQLADVSLESLGVGLKQLSKNMLEAQSGTGDARDAFRALKVEVESSRGVLKPTEEVLLSVADRFSKMEDGAGKTALAMKIFGKAGADLIPFLNQGRAGIEELRREAERLGVIVSKDFAKQAEEFNDNLRRLKSSSEGLSIQLAGPLVKALGEATDAMVKAKMHGEGFFTVLKEGFQRAFTGDDAHKWNEQIVEATNRLLDAQKLLDQAKFNFSQTRTPFDADQVKRFTQEMKLAQAEVDRLQKIKPVLLGKEKTDATDKKEDAPEKRSREQIEAEARRLQEQFEAEQQLLTDTAGITADFRNRELEQEKANYDARLKAWFDFIDQEQEAAIARSAELLEIERTAEEQRTRLGYKHNELNLSSAKTFFGSMSVLMNTNSKKQFEIGKAAAISETVINTYSAAMAAFNSLARIPYVGYYLGIAAAAATISYGMTQVQNIRARSFSSAGGAAGGGAAPVVQASAVTGQPTGTPGGDVGPQRQRGPDTIIHLHGDTFGRKQVRDLVTQLNEEGRDGGRIFLAD